MVVAVQMRWEQVMLLLRAKRADLTPPLHKRSQKVASCAGVGNALLTLPVEKRSHLTLSAQWSLEEPLDGGLEAPSIASFRSCLHCRSDEASAVIK